jgi:uncharacterized membrane protein YqhA
MSRKVRSLADEQDHVSLNMPSIEHRSLMESGMRRPTTRWDMVIVAVFFVALAALLVYFLVPVMTTLIRHIPDLFTSTGK